MEIKYTGLKDKNGIKIYNGYTITGFYYEIYFFTKRKIRFKSKVNYSRVNNDYHITDVNYPGKDNLLLDRRESLIDCHDLEVTIDNNTIKIMREIVNFKKAKLEQIRQELKQNLNKALKFSVDIEHVLNSLSEKEFLEWKEYFFALEIEREKKYGTYNNSDSNSPLVPIYSISVEKYQSKPKLTNKLYIDLSLDSLVKFGEVYSEYHDWFEDISEIKEEVFELEKLYN